MREGLCCLDLYRVSARALRNRHLFAETAGRIVFRKWELVNYFLVIFFFPIAKIFSRVIFSAAPRIDGSLVVGSKTRSLFRPVIENEIPMDDMSPRLSECNWRYFDLRIALKYYLTLVRSFPFLIGLMRKRSVQSSAYYGICLLKMVYFNQLFLRSIGLKNIYCGYCVDRTSILLGELCVRHGLKMIGLQHGAFNMFPFLHKGKVDKVILRSDFSVPYAEMFFSFKTNVCIDVSPELFEFGWGKYVGSKTEFIVFGASADSLNLNREVIMALDEVIPKNIGILVKLHPRDKMALYRGVVADRIEFVEKNATNAIAYVGALSSVMAEAHSFGVSIFPFKNNIKQNSDFMLEVNPTVYESVREMVDALKEYCMTYKESNRMKNL